MGKVLTCPHCNKPVTVCYDEATGTTAPLDINKVPGGQYEIIDANPTIMRRRVTKTGKPTRSGKGHKIHSCAEPQLAQIGVITSQTPKPPPDTPSDDSVEETSGIPTILIEICALLGTQHYNDAIIENPEWTQSLGRGTCPHCSASIIACQTITGNVIILDDKDIPSGPWRTYVKDGIPRAEFRSAKDTHAKRINHSIHCNAALKENPAWKIKQSTSGQQ